jgi:hypothetical protein
MNGCTRIQVKAMLASKGEGYQGLEGRKTVSNSTDKRMLAQATAVLCLGVRLSGPVCAGLNP